MARAKNKKSMLYIGAGLASALVAVLIYSKVNGNRPKPAPDDRVDVLLAARDIGYGELIELSGTGANVGFEKWPKNKVPDGAIREAKQVTDHRMRARANIAKHEVIQSKRIAADEEFVPEDMYAEPVGVSAEDVKSRRFRPGMKVDVLKIVGNTASEFMRNVQIYAVGKLDLFGIPVKDGDVPPNVFLLIKKADRIAFIEGQLGGSKFRLVEAADPRGEEAVLVDQSALPEARKKQAQAVFDRAKQLFDAGDYERALVDLEQVTKQYSDVASVATEAEALGEKCQQFAADALLKSARQAFDTRQDYATALMLLDEIEGSFPRATQAIAQARELRPSIEKAKGQSDRLASYRALVQQIQEALSQGNLPLAEQKVADLEPFAGETFTDAGETPAQAQRRYEDELKEKTRQYDLDTKVLESHLAQHNLTQAREKLQQIKRQFPGHPQLARLEETVNKATGGM